MTQQAPMHTQGPWVGFADKGKVVAIMPAGRRGDVCTFGVCPSDADAALMIAAPDLLAALRDWLMLEASTLQGSQYKSAYNRCKANARAAITKAQGG